MMPRRTLLALAVAGCALLYGCVRELESAHCPCLAGWVCCDETNMCIREGSACEGAPESVSDGAIAPGQTGSGEETCAGGREPSTRVCPGAPHAYAALPTPRATLAALLGRWQLCDGEGFGFGPVNARSGIEFTVDGKFFLLGEDAQGALQRVVGLHTTGDYEGEDDSVNIHFLFAEGGSSSFYPSFDASKANLYTGVVGFAFNSMYVRVPPGADKAHGVVVPGMCLPPTADAGAQGDAATCEPEASLVCPGGPFAFSLLKSAALTAHAIVGRWQLCEGKGFPWAPAHANAGIEITSDGKFFMLGLNAEGALQRASGGLRATGSYELPDGDADQLDLAFAEGGGASIRPSFDDDKAHFHAGTGDSPSSFVRVPPVADKVDGVVVPPTCVAPADAGTRADASTCDGGASQVCPGAHAAFTQLSSQAQTAQALVGRWQLCKGPGLGWGPVAANAGIEFTSDGKFFMLALDAEGALQRVLVGLRATGGYELDERTPDVAYLKFPEGGESALHPAFDAEKTHLLAFDAWGIVATYYVRVAPEADNVPGVGAAPACAS